MTSYLPPPARSCGVIRPNGFVLATPRFDRLKQWLVDLIGAAIGEGKLIDCNRVETAGLLLNFDEGAQKRTRLHADRGDRVKEAIRVGEQVATLAVRGLLKRPSETD